MIITQIECVFVALHVPYCHLWPAPLYNIFSTHYLIKGTIFEKKKY